MGQMLTWRTLRAKIGTTSYVTEQPFFHNAPESNKSRTQVRADTERLNAIDPVIAKLNAQRSELAAGVTIGGLADIDDPFASMRSQQSATQKAYDANRQALQKNFDAVERAKERNALKAAGSSATDMRHGNGPDDLVTNDKTDILEATDEFRLLLTWLNPDQASVWHTQINHQVNLPFTTREKGADPHRADTSFVYMRGPDMLTRLSAVMPDDAFGDAVIKPRRVLKAFFQEHTSQAAVNSILQTPDAVRLFDDYVHDSRAWFRVPYFREYVPGGYFWARVFFIGGDQRVENLGSS